MAYTADPELAAIEDKLPHSDLSDLAAAREHSLEMRRLQKYEPHRELTTRDVTVEGINNNPPVRVRVFTPTEPDRQHGQGPLLQVIPQEKHIPQLPSDRRLTSDGSEVVGSSCRVTSGDSTAFGLGSRLT